MISSAYNGWIDPVINPKTDPFLITGEAPVGGRKMRTVKEAAKLFGKPKAPIFRNGQGKRSSNLGAITANDVFDETKAIAGQGVKKVTEPFVSSGPTLNNIIHHANNYIRKNKLTTVVASNGKTYVKMPDGKLKSLESLGRDVIKEQGYY